MWWGRRIKIFFSFWEELTDSSVCVALRTLKTDRQVSINGEYEQINEWILIRSSKHCIDGVKNFTFSLLKNLFYLFYLFIL